MPRCRLVGLVSESFRDWLIGSGKYGVRSGVSPPRHLGPTPSLRWCTKEPPWWNGQTHRPTNGHLWGNCMVLLASEWEGRGLLIGTKWHACFGCVTSKRNLLASPRRSKLQREIRGPLAFAYHGRPLTASPVHEMTSRKRATVPSRPRVGSLAAWPCHTSLPSWQVACSNAYCVCSPR